MVNIEYLNNERELLWKEITQIKDEKLPNINQKISELTKSLPDDISDLKSYKQSIAHLKSAFKEYKETFKDITEKCTLASENAKNIITTYKEISQVKKELDDINQTIVKNAFTIKETLEQNLDLPSKIKATLEEMDNWDASYQSSIKKSHEIKQLYAQIFGIDINKNGEKIHEDGLIDELNIAYDDLSTKLKTLEQETKLKHDNLIQEWDDKYIKLQSKIEGLLPGAMSTGLAHAYKDKREMEEKEQKNTLRSFYIAISGLCIVSILPITLNWSILKSVFQTETDVLQSIKNMGNLIWSMLPIYAPLLWLAIYTNRRLNLSKKIIEEYSYKEAVAKTYQGLSGAIQKIENDEVSKKVQERLLGITLDSAADNPSKYITNYDKCDNPIMEVLNNKNLLKLLQNKEFDSVYEKIINLAKSFKFDVNRTTKKEQAKTESDE